MGKRLYDQSPEYALWNWSHRTRVAATSAAAAHTEAARGVTSDVGPKSSIISVS